MADITNNKKLKETNREDIDMSMENEIYELNGELRQLETFLEVFEEYAQEYSGKEVLDYVNGVVSMISMQSAKVKQLIEIADKLESEIRKNGSA